MEHDDILEMMMETIMEMEMGIQARSKSRQEYEKAEFGSGYSIIEEDDQREAA